MRSLQTQNPKPRAKRREARAVDADTLLEVGLDFDGEHYLREGWTLADGLPNPRMLTVIAASVARVWHANGVLPPDILRLIASLVRRAGLFFEAGQWSQPLPAQLRDALAELPGAQTHEVLAGWAVRVVPTLRRWADLRGVVAHLEAVHRLLRLDLAIAAVPRHRAIGFASYERWLLEDDPGYHALHDVITAVTKRS